VSIVLRLDHIQVVNQSILIRDPKGIPLKKVRDLLLVIDARLYHFDTWYRASRRLW
jgi:hypothetical protein